MSARTVSVKVASVRVLSAFLLAAAVLAAGAPGAVAQTGAGYRVVAARTGFAGIEARLNAAIAKHGMIAVTRASASDGAAGRGLSIRGDVVIGVFRNDVAIRMLAANLDAGIEAPVRFHLVEEAGGGASIRFHLPSVVFGRYEGEAIKALGRELDPIFEAIARDAAD